MRHQWLVGVAVAVLFGHATPAAAQTTVEQWHKATALALFGGAASANGGTDGTVGASIGWEFTPRFTLEGSGLWMPGGGPDVFSALFGSRVNLLPPRAAVPFVSVGLGMHRAEVAPGGRDVPRFYMRRMGAPGPQMMGERTFDDFLVAFGGGVDVYLRRHLALRPDIRVLLVNADAGTRAIAVYGVHLAYHFEEHPITP
jgi:hypothetical protein